MRRAPETRAHVRLQPARHGCRAQHVSPRLSRPIGYAASTRISTNSLVPPERHARSPAQHAAAPCPASGPVPSPLPHAPVCLRSVARRRSSARGVSSRTDMTTDAAGAGREGAVRGRGGGPSEREQKKGESAGTPRRALTRSAAHLNASGSMYRPPSHHHALLSCLSLALVVREAAQRSAAPKTSRQTPFAKGPPARLPLRVAQRRSGRSASSARRSLAATPEAASANTKARA